MREYRKILIIRFGAIGDVILTTSFIRALRNRYPDSEIHFLTKSFHSDLLKFNPHLNQIFGFDSKNQSDTSLVKKVRSQKYDLIIDLQRNIRSTRICWFGNAKRVTKYKKSLLKRYLLLWFRHRSVKESRSVIEKYFNVISGLEGSKETEVFYPKEIEQSIPSFSNPIITICPGASIATKQWREEGFCEVGIQLKKRGYDIVYHGGIKEKELCHRLAQKTGDISLAGKLNLLESAALLNRSHLVLANDSGMLHLAQSQGTKVVGIFGPTTKDWGFFPFGENSKVVENNELSCRPCHSKGPSSCKKGHFKCMKDISSQNVIHATDTLLTT